MGSGAVAFWLELVLVSLLQNTGDFSGRLWEVKRKLGRAYETMQDAKQCASPSLAATQQALVKILLAQYAVDAVYCQLDQVLAAVEASTSVAFIPAERAAIIEAVVALPSKECG